MMNQKTGKMRMKDRKTMTSKLEKKMSVYIYGPQGCGKTHHAESLAKFFGLSYIMDGFHFSTHVFPTHGTLVLGQSKIKDRDDVVQHTFNSIMKKVQRRKQA